MADRPDQLLGPDRPIRSGEGPNLLYLNRLTTLGHLLDGLVHGVNNSLQAISGIAELMAPANAAQQADLGRIGDRVVRARAELEELVRMARPPGTPPGVVDLVEVLQQALALRRHQQRMARIGVTSAFPDSPCLVHGVAQYFLLAVLNLLINAEQAIAGHARPAIELGLEPIGAESAARPPGRRAFRVSVVDNGPGVAEEHRELVFQPFFTTRAEAAGLGLTVARTLIEGAGGRLWAEAASGGGAVFRLELPAAPDV
jgi:signal transduction histidine kinase